MIELNTNRFKIPPYKHQLQGVKVLLQNPVFGLFWEMRLGKTKTIIDTACVKFENNIIDACVIASPAQVKDVWRDPEIGEIQKHCYLPTSGAGEVYTFHYNARNESMLEDLFFNYERVFIVTSFEFLRQEDAQGNFPKVESLLKAIGRRRFWLVLDEASALSNVKALQTKAVYKLRQPAAQVTELDGTPAGNSTLDLYSKFMILDKAILGYKSFWEFQRNHTTQKRVVFKGRKPFNKITGFTNLDYITERTKPFCWYLEQKDALDMPEKVRTFFTVALTPTTWRVYKKMRDELIAELDGEQTIVTNASVKVMRLAQICAGFLGGFEGQEAEVQATQLGSMMPAVAKELSSETTDALVAWLKERLAERPNFKAVLWCRWRPEIVRLLNKVEAAFTTRELFTAAYYGGQKDENFLHPDHPYQGAGVIVAQPQAARFGVNYSKADTVAYLSQDYNLVTRSQSEDRVQAPKTRKTTLLVDVLVTGPEGQRTIIHDIVKSLASKEDIARRTTSRWKEVLRQE